MAFSHDQMKVASNATYNNVNGAVKFVNNCDVETYFERRL